MGKLKVTIEKGPDLFGAWADNVPGIYGEGETVQETKENLLASIELYKKHNSTVPKELQGEISVEWTFDVQSFLQYYSGIFTKAALERITGAQVEKIESALHGFLNDISQVHLA